jgi:hypothetical protein
MAIMVLALITNLIPDPQRPKEEKLATGQMTSQYPPMIGHMAKVVAVAAQPGHTPPKKIHRIRSPTMRVPT